MHIKISIFHWDLSEEEKSLRNKLGLQSHTRIGLGLELGWAGLKLGWCWVEVGVGLVLDWGKNWFPDKKIGLGLGGFSLGEVCI